LRLAHPMKTKQSNKDLTAVTTFVAIASAVIFSIVFFSYRSEDSGKTGSLFGSLLSSFSSGKVFGFRPLAENIGGIFISLLIVAAWFGLGNFIVKLFDKSENKTYGNRQMDFAVCSALGSGVWSLIWFFLGVAGLYRKPVALICLLVGIALGILAIKGKRIKRNEEEKTTTLSKIAFSVVLIPVVLAFVAAIAPPTGKDALIYHISLPKAYITAGALIEVTNNIASFYSHGAEMHGVWAMLSGGIISERVGEVAFTVTLFAFFPLLLLAIYGWSKKLGLGSELSLIAVALFATVPTAFYVASNGYIDLALAFYVVTAVFMVSCWWSGLENKYLIFASIALGAALATKLTGAFAFFPLLVVFLLRAREAQEGDEKSRANKILLTGILTLALAGVLASPWYISNLVKTGSPIFPFYQNLLSGQAIGWDKERSQLLQLFLANYGGSPKSILDYAAAPFYLSLVAQPDKATFYDGVIGISFLVGVIILIIAFLKLQLESEVKIILGTAGTLYFCWLFSSQQIRFLLPMLSLLSIMIAVAVKKASTKNHLSQILLLTTVCGLSVTFAWFLKENPVRVVLGGEAREEYLQRRLDYYPYYKIINTQLTSDAKVWLINMRRDSYHINRSYFSDYTFEDYTLVKYLNEADNLSELRACVKADGITHLMIKYDVLLDYERSSVINEKLTSQENQAKMDLLKAFLKDGTNILKSDSNFMLIELPK